MSRKVRRVSAVTAGLAAGCTALSVAPAGAEQAEQTGAEQPARIHDIQGTGRLSALAGQQVTDVPGIVTGVRTFGDSRGFWFQDDQPDNDPRTSEGLYVYTGSESPSVTPGDRVTVSGKVEEYYPLSEGESPEDTPNQSVTELSDAQVSNQGKAAVPAAEAIGPDTVPEAWSATGNLEKQPLDPTRFALDYYESREGMNVRVDNARVVGPTDEYHSLWVTSKPEQNANQRGGTTYTSYQDPNSGRLKIESLLPFDQHPFPKANVGDRLEGATSGPLDYTNYGGYVLEAAALGKHVPGGLQPETTRKQNPDELAVATYNVENLAATDNQAKFDQLAQGVTRNLAAPDILTLEEVQDNNGATDDGTVAADKTLRRFADAIAAAGGPHYQWREKVGGQAG